MARVTPNPKRPTRKTKQAAKLAAEQQTKRRVRLLRVIHAAAVAAALGGLAVGYSALASHVRAEVAVPTEPLEAWIVDRPAWMSQDVAEQVGREALVAAGESSMLDAAALERAVDALAKNPWVAEVTQVRRDGNRLLILCEWRTPAAVVRWDGGPGFAHHLVAAEREGEATKAVLLPMTYDAGTVRRMRDGSAGGVDQLRLVDGIATPPPSRPGESWSSPSLAAALDVAALLHGRPEASVVTAIDVTNLARPTSRDASPIVLRTRFGTDVYWGGPPAGGDFLVEPSPQDKLANLRSAATRFAGKRWPAYVDLRLDRAVFPTQ